MYLLVLLHEKVCGMFCSSVPFLQQLKVS